MEPIRIPAENLPYLAEQIAKLNKRAAKLGVEAVTMTASDPIVEQSVDELGFEVIETFYDVTVAGAAPKFAGWKLLGVIEPLAEGLNLLRAVPGEEIPGSYKSSDPFLCDHCKKVRRRKETFVVQHEDGSIMQVGRQCIADFLGHQSPEYYLQIAKYIREFSTLLEDEELWSRGPRRVPLYSVKSLVSMAVLAVERFGWCSKANATQERPSTASHIGHFEHIKHEYRTLANYLARERWAKEIDWLAPTPESDAKAEIIMAWGDEFVARKSGNYFDNLGALLAVRATTGVKWNTVGLLASLVGLYERELAQQAEAKLEAAERPVSVHVGTVGARLQTPVTVVSVRHIESDWGLSTLYVFLTPEGNRLKWFSSASWSLDQHEEAVIKGTVKRHESYKGQDETLLTRVSLVSRA